VLSKASSAIPENRGKLFLIVFFSIQYRKLISYWNCKVTNTSVTHAQANEKIEDGVMTPFSEYDCGLVEMYNHEKWCPKNHFEMSLQQQITFPRRC
jgi:hypothetical protein